MIRIIPYPPSFRRIAAKIIDPAIGASTWALGSHKCTINIGSFTRNPMYKKMENILLFIGIYNVMVNIFGDRDHVYRRINMRSMGSDAAMVYIIMYILACTRSG